jgi:excisionase family DNA binding protein
MTKSPQLSKLLTMHEVASCLSVSPKTVQRLIERRELQTYRISRVVRISEQDLRAYVALQRDI